MSLIKQNIYFFLPYSILLLLGIFLNSQYSQKEIFYFINRHHSQFSDTFFKYYTNVGDGLFYLLIVGILLFVSFRYAIIAFVAWGIQGIIVQLLKHVAFPDHVRPWQALEGDKNIHLIPDFSPFINNSFPSGHSATAFCMFAMFSFFSKKKIWGFVFFILAATVAYSRIYLVQHFFLDTYAGSIIGVLVASIVWLLMRNSLNQSWAKNNLLTLKNIKA